MVPMLCSNTPNIMTLHHLRACSVIDITCVLECIEWDCDVF
jgi:hypothetical protein